MLDITNVNHVGIRISDKARSIEFYSLLGFDLVNDAGFESGHPVIMKHPSGVVLNLLGPADVPGDVNILMDVDEKHTGMSTTSRSPGRSALATCQPYLFVIRIAM